MVEELKQKIRALLEQANDIKLLKYIYSLLKKYAGKE